MKKGLFRKSVSLLLSAALLLLLFVPALAASDKQGKNPLLIVTGFTEYTLVDTTTGTAAFPPDTQNIVNTVAAAAPALLQLLVSGRTQADFDALCDAVLPVVNALFDPIACNPDGTIKHNEVGLAVQYPESVAEYGLETIMQPEAFDKDLLPAAVNAVGAENVYVYGLDWRLDPMDIADEINEWVQHIQAQTGAEKVSIAGISMGGVMVSAYLAKYGTADISNVTMISSAFTGLEYVGRLFRGELEIDENGLYLLLEQLIGSDVLTRIFGSTGIVRYLIALVDDLYAACGDRIFTECLIPAFGYNPGMWSFVPAADYASCKAFMFSRMDSTDAEKAALEAKLDAYHEVQANVGSTLKAAKAAGVNVAIVSNYNWQMPPVSTASEMTGDQVIETMHTSGFATCANIGETLPEGVTGGYVSPDRMIDASTCLLPDETWFIKNMKHVDFSIAQNQCDFYIWLMTTETPVNIHSNAAYPQFLLYNPETKVLTPQTMLRGDVNFDGRVDLVDARLVLRHVRSFITLSAVALEAADMDGNNMVLHADAQAIMDSYAGTKTQTASALFAMESLTQTPEEDTGSTGGTLRSAAEDVAGQIRDALGSLGSVLQRSASSAPSKEADTTTPDAQADDETAEAASAAAQACTETSTAA